MIAPASRIYLSVFAFILLSTLVACFPFHRASSAHCKHESCGKCPLYADTNAADKVRVRNAAKKAARSVKRKVRVDVDAMLKDPPAAANSHGRRR